MKPIVIIPRTLVRTIVNLDNSQRVPRIRASIKLTPDMEVPLVLVSPLKPKPRPFNAH